MAKLDMVSILDTLEILNLKPQTLVQVANMPTTEVFDNIFANNVFTSSEEALLRKMWTKTVQLVTYKPKGGKYTPVQTDTFSMEKLQPLDIKLVENIDPDKIKRYMLATNITSLAGIFQEIITTFMLHKQKMILNQCSEFFSAGTTSFQYETGAGGEMSDKTLDWTAVDGAINTKSYSTGFLHDWSDAGAKAGDVDSDIGALVKFMYETTNGMFFKKGAKLVIMAGDTAYNAAVDLYNPEATVGQGSIFRGDDWTYTVGSKRIPLINSTMDYTKFKYNTTTGKFDETDYSALGLKDIALVDISAGNFGVVDLKFVNIKNFDKITSRPYELEFEYARFNEGIDVAFASRTIAFGRTAAVIKGTVVS